MTKILSAYALLAFLVISMVSADACVMHDDAHFIIGGQPAGIKSPAIDLKAKGVEGNWIQWRRPGDQRETVKVDSSFKGEGILIGVDVMENHHYYFKITTWSDANKTLVNHLYQIPDGKTSCSIPLPLGSHCSAVQAGEMSN